MNTIETDGSSMAAREAREFEARAILAAGRPVLASVFCSLLGLAYVTLLIASDLAWVTKVALASMGSVPPLGFEIWYLSRQVEALRVLQGNTREEQ